MHNELEKKIRHYLNGARKSVAYLATIDTDAGNIPEIRTMTLLECDWHFYIATGTGSRKARELSKYPKTAVLVPLRDEKYCGYLRMTGTIQLMTDSETIRAITERSEYPINCHWKGVNDPDLFFVQIIPDRVEFMAPGEDVATDVTSEFPR